MPKSPAIKASGGRVHAVGSTVSGEVGGRADCDDYLADRLDSGDGEPCVILDSGTVILAGQSTEFVRGGRDGLVP